jgi:methionine--tRNA ligase beta chain
MTESIQPATVSAPATAPTAAAPAVPEQKPLVSYETFAQLDLRIATVLEAREHPNANKLLLLKIQVGEAVKQIVAGIKAHYDPQALVGTQIVIVNNLEPAMLRGEESQGMLLAASDAGGLALLRPEKPLSSGAKVK